MFDDNDEAKRDDGRVAVASGSVRRAAGRRRRRRRSSGKHWSLGRVFLTWPGAGRWIRSRSTGGGTVGVTHRRTMRRGHAAEPAFVPIVTDAMPAGEPAPPTLVTPAIEVRLAGCCGACGVWPGRCSARWRGLQLSLDRKPPKHSRLSRGGGPAWCLARRAGRSPRLLLTDGRAGEGSLASRLTVQLRAGSASAGCIPGATCRPAQNAERTLPHLGCSAAGPSAGQGRTQSSQTPSLAIRHERLCAPACPLAAKSAPPPAPFSQLDPRPQQAPTVARVTAVHG